MTAEQQVRLEVIRILLERNVALSNLLEYTERLVKFILTGEKWQESTSEDLFRERFTENPLHIKFHTETGIPVEFK